MATISTLLPYIYSRIDESVENGPTFWTQNEAESAAMEALCDLTLLIGRPDQLVSVPFSVAPNTVWQTIPSEIFALTNVQGAVSEVWKITLADMDGCQVSGPDWEQDIGDQILKWGPIGFGKFFVWPAVAQAQTVLLTGVSSPVTSVWPDYSNASVPFPNEFFQCIEKYAASYLAFKEGGASFKDSMADYQSYLQDAKTLTKLQDRIDPFLFSGSIGAQIVANPTTQR